MYKNRRSDVRAKHHESLADNRSGRGFCDDHGDELRIEPGFEYGEVQWDDSDGVELECNEHRHHGSEWGDNGKPSGVCQRSEQQRIEFHRGVSTEYHESLKNFRGCWGLRHDYWDELRIESGFRDSEVQWN